MANEGEVRSSGYFDRFSAFTSQQVSRAWFFMACTISILIWALTGPVFGFSEPWQLVVNTGTTIITFLLVALLQNSQDRSDKAIHHKLDAIAVAVSNILEDTSATDGDDNHDKCIRSLREMAGVEMEESS